MTALELASTDELLVELQKRYDHAIFAGIKHRPTVDAPSAVIRSWRYVGSEFMCIALAHKLGLVCQDNIDQQETSIAPDEL